MMRHVNAFAVVALALSLSFVDALDCRTPVSATNYVANFASGGVAGIANWDDDEPKFYSLPTSDGTTAADRYVSERGPSTERVYDTLHESGLLTEDSAPNVVWANRDDTLLFVVRRTGGVFRSDDRALSWTRPLTVADGLMLRDLDGSDSGQYMLAAQSAIDPVDTTVTPGLWASQDGGVTWSAGRGQAYIINVSGVAVSTDGMFMAGVGTTRAHETRVVTSRDGGRSWTSISVQATLPSDSVNMPMHLVMNRRDHSTLHVLHNTSPTDRHVYRSVDDGATWTIWYASSATATCDRLTCDERCVHMLLSECADTVFHQSHDGGETWSSVGMSGHTDVYDQALLSWRDPDWLLAFTAGTAHVSHDGGASFAVLPSLYDLDRDWSQCQLGPPVDGQPRVGHVASCRVECEFAGPPATITCDSAGDQFTATTPGPGCTSSAISGCIPPAPADGYDVSGCQAALSTLRSCHVRCANNVPNKRVLGHAIARCTTGDGNEQFALAGCEVCELNQVLCPALAEGFRCVADCISSCALFPTLHVATNTCGNTVSTCGAHYQCDSLQKWRNKPDMATIVCDNDPCSMYECCDADADFGRAHVRGDDAGLFLGNDDSLVQVGTDDNGAALVTAEAPDGNMQTVNVVDMWEELQELKYEMTCHRLGQVYKRGKACEAIAV